MHRLGLHGQGLIPLDSLFWMQCTCDHERPTRFLPTRFEGNRGKSGRSYHGASVLVTMLPLLSEDRIVSIIRTRCFWKSVLTGASKHSTVGIGLDAAENGDRASSIS